MTPNYMIREGEVTGCRMPTRRSDGSLRAQNRSQQISVVRLQSHNETTESRCCGSRREGSANRLSYALVDAWVEAYPREPEAVTLDIDDTCDVVHGRRQLSLFHAHYDELCFHLRRTHGRSSPRWLAGLPGWRVSPRIRAVETPFGQRSRHRAPGQLRGRAGRFLARIATGRRQRPACTASLTICPRSSTIAPGRSARNGTCRPDATCHAGRELPKRRRTGGKVSRSPMGRGRALVRRRGRG